MIEQEKESKRVGKTERGAVVENARQIIHLKINVFTSM